jgi:3-phytase
VGPLPEGLIVIQDDVNDIGTQNFKYVDWRAVKAALRL